MKKILVFVIKLYQYLISPLLGNRCRFLPTCSSYFIEALETHGLIKGCYLGTRRILKCHPFKKLGASSGIDFVPIPKNTSRKERLRVIVDGLQKAGLKLEDKGSKNG